ncbi:MAG: transporter substrate-binding domain-containing protein [Bacilli bacterium]|nr:transporter substrate-binding domain-containing protein [Bacilli bacterium]
MFKKIARSLSLALLLLFPVLFLSSCGNNQSKLAEITSLDQLNDSSIRIGVASDTAEDAKAKKSFPKASLEYYSELSPALIAVSQGKIDAFIYDRLQIEIAIDEGAEGVRLLKENIGEPNIGAAAISPKTKVEDLQGKINTFLANIEADGTFADIRRRWIEERTYETAELTAPTNPDFTLTVATTGVNMPFSFMLDNHLVGHDVELATRFAYSINANVEFKTYSFDNIVAAAKEGRVDCIFSNLFMTEERKESLAFSTATYTGYVGAAVRKPTKSKTKTLDDLKSAKIGVLMGSNHPEYVEQRLPGATVEYFNSVSDLVGALQTGKIEAVAIDEPVGHSILSQYSNIELVSESLAELDYAFLFAKTEEGGALASEISTFIAKKKTDGSIAALQKKWFESDSLDSLDMLDYEALPSTNGTVSIATNPNPPFSLVSGTRYVGYDIEILALFCQEAGYALTVIDVNTDAIIPSILSGKTIGGCGGWTISEERKEKINFSDPVYTGGIKLLVLNGDPSSNNQNFFEAIAEGFEKTFIREERWKLFLSGIVTTLLITFLSIVFGTALGFGVFLLCRKGNKVANLIARVFVYLIQGMPAVVLLMILYYIVFGNVPIAGEAVSIVGFTLIFGSGVFNMLKSGVATVDKGQTEAAYALGYRDARTFFRIVLPQAIPHMLPTYKGEITALIKATAIVGYVAVQDVTKIGDIVRSRTFEPFFPLIAVAILYFLLAAILIFLVNRVEALLNPRRKKSKKLLKGVKLQ